MNEIALKIENNEEAFNDEKTALSLLDISNDKNIDWVDLKQPRVINLGDSKRLCIREVNHNGRDFIDIRRYVRFTNSVEFTPTRKGICISKTIFNDLLMPALEGFKTS